MYITELYEVINEYEKSLGEDFVITMTASGEGISICSLEIKIECHLNEQSIFHFFKDNELTKKILMSKLDYLLSLLNNDLYSTCKINKNLSHKIDCFLRKKDENND